MIETDLKENNNKESEILKILKKSELLNLYYKENLVFKEKSNFIIENDLKIFHFIFLYLFKTIKYKDIKLLFNKKNKNIICKKNNSNNISNNSYQKISFIIQKFISICLINHDNLSLYFKLTHYSYIQKILKIVKIFFLNNYIDENSFQKIIILQIILCLYKENKRNENKIQNIKYLYIIIDYLLSFCSNNNYYMTEYKVKQFNNTVKNILDIIDKNILITYNNKIILSKNKKFYNLIQLSQIVTLKVTSKIIKSLINVYIHKLNIDYVFGDLSKQFLYKTKKENITNKTNLLIAKNFFLNELFEKEKIYYKENEIFIKNGFYFDDSENNGIICNSINKFTNENNGYSIVLSFRLINENENKNKEKSIYTIFSLTSKDNIITHLYIEGNKLKLKTKKEKKCFELYEISNNTNYVLWIIQKKEKKHKMIFFLNNSKNILNNVYYPEGNYKINLGFDGIGSTSKNNFVGIIGTFMIFKKCLIKDENDFINITKLTELKGNYEDIIYTKTRKEWSFIDKNLNLILNKISNDINIYEDIEIIISTKSLGLYNYNNLNEYNCNYFKNNDLKNPSPTFYFKNKNIKDENNILNSSIQSNNAFIDFINNYGFLYLQLELYYFINILSLKLNEDKNNGINIIKLCEEQDVYLNISRISSLFFFCLDYLNSNFFIINSQYSLITKEIENFKYTLIDLISIYSKYDCKIKTYFLSLFVEKISEKKYFEYCSFILTFEFYEINDNDAFDVLFNYLNHMSFDDYDNEQIKKLFMKLIDFDKIYISDKIKNETKKEYSKLMRYLIKKIITEQIEDCFIPFQTKIKNLKEELIKNNIINDGIQEEEINNENDGKSNRFNSEDYNTENIRKNSRTSSKVSGNKNANENENNGKKNIELLTLIYKYLKNLYIGINDVKKKFIESCNDIKNILYIFFNDLFYNLSKIYPIEIGENNNNISSSNPQKKEIIISELIKSLCIRYLDDLFFEDNIKLLDDESKKQKNEDNQDEYDYKKGSSGSLKTSFNSCKTTVRPSLKDGKLFSSLKKTESNGSIINSLNSSLQNSFISNSFQPLTIEGILTSKMDFFDKPIISPYTFKSIFFMLLRDLSNEIKLKIIKNDKNIKKKFLMSEKHFSKTRFLIGIIISLFEKLNCNGFDTIFMSKIEIIEYCYDFFIGLIKNLLDNYLESNVGKRKNLKPMINSIFVDKKNNYNINRFFLIMIEIVFNFNYIRKNKENKDLVKERLDKLLIKIQNDITEIINKSIYELIDFFYFKFLREIYVENDINDNYVIKTITIMIEKIVKRLDEKNINRIIEINCKNILILVYKIIFYVNKRNIILSSENESFLKSLILFISKSIDNCNILYTKILFPIEEVNPKNSRRKLLIELIFEIIFEMHLDYIRHPNLTLLQTSEFLLNGLFNEKNMEANLVEHIIFKKRSKHKKKEEQEKNSPFYIIDKIGYFNKNSSNKDIIKINEEISINKEFYDLKEYLLSKYKDEYNEEKNLFSVSIIFAIKLILAIKELNNIQNKKILKKNKDNKIKTPDSKEIQEKKNNKFFSKDLFNDELKKQFINICKNILKIHKEHTSLNPFKSIGIHSNNLYEYFRSFIVDKMSFVEGDPNIKIKELLDNLEDNKKSIKIYERVIYTKEGRAKLYNEITYNQIMMNKRQKSEINLVKDNESIGSLQDKKSKYSSEDKSSNNFNSSLKGSFNSVNLNIKPITKFNINNSSKSQSQVFKTNNLLTNSTNTNDKILYNNTIKFEKDLIKKYFSFYFNKLLSYNEDFINIRNIYTSKYYKEIDDLNEYKSSYPLKFKNYITNNYMRPYLKKDFDFFNDRYIKYTHNFLYSNESNYNYEIQNKLLFPLKSLLEENDNANKDILLNSNLGEINIYECEILTDKGSVFGNILAFDNCLLFKSDLKIDKRKSNPKNKNNNNGEKINYLNYVCCSTDYEHLNKNKKIIIEFKDIKEVINRTYFYSWISLEIFMKNGKSYLFNFFNEETNNDMLEFLKCQKIHVVRKIPEFFKKEDFPKKWKEGKISTFDYLLLLNKMSSRTFNDPGQYPIMPWIFLENGIKSIRNFDLPISVQDQDKQEQFLSNKGNYGINGKSHSHGNHYSTSAYIYFYLMRINPFTNNMIKFQSNKFDIPERQFADIKQTIYLCQRNNNNRELIPELFTIPEIYLNLNYNDFGKRTDSIRVHNITFGPYAKNPFEFCYLLKNLLNNNIEINNNINKWFDFVFGVNQIENYISNKNNNMSIQNQKQYKLLRKFNSYCYGQYYNYKKMLLEGKKYNKTDEELFSEIKSSLTISINFGQTPFQIFSEVHPSKNIQLEKEELNKSNTTKIASSTKNGNNNTNSNNLNIKTNSNSKINKKNENKIEMDDIKNNNNHNNILYFLKSFDNNYFYCLLDNMDLEIYKIYDNEKNIYSINKKISIKSQFLRLKSRQMFCELSENSFIFCRTLDKTLRYINNDNETSFLLKSYTTCILKINNKEFITGHDNGKICKWNIDYSNESNKIDLNLILIIKSNKHLITCLAYNEKLNIIISSDNETIITRKLYDFEYLNSIKIKNKQNQNKSIINIKISDYDIIYVLIYIEDNDIYELQGFTLNGTYIGNYKGNIINYEISKRGNIIIKEKNRPIVKILNAINFNEIYNKEIIFNSSSNYVDFFFEEPNILYYGYKENEFLRIKIFALEQNEEKIYISI